MRTIESAYEHDTLAAIRIVFTDGTTALIDYASAKAHGLLTGYPGRAFLPGLACRKAKVDGHRLVSLDPPMSEPRSFELAMMDDAERARWLLRTPEQRYIGDFASAGMTDAQAAALQAQAKALSS